MFIYTFISVRASLLVPVTSFTLVECCIAYMHPFDNTDVSL